MIRPILIIGKQVRAPHRRAWLAAVVVASATAACTASAGPASGPPLVIATTSILGDLVAGLAAGDLTVEVLIPPGADPHDVELSARDAARLREADLVVANGLGLEEGLADALAGAAADGVEVVEIAPLLDPLRTDREGEGPGADDDPDEGDDPGADDDHDEGDDHDDGGGFDPHVWHDPVRMAEAVRLIGERLAGVESGVGAAEWADRAAGMADEILAAHDRITVALSAIPPERRKLVTNHDTFRYFAARYDFEVIGVVIPGGSTLAEPSAAELAGLVDTIRAAGVGAVFAENIGSSRLIEVVAAELGSSVVVVELFTDALGEPGSEAGTYLGMIETNAARIAGALG